MGANHFRIADRRGFTLLELMLVISIIAILVSITLPSLGKARGKSEQVGCAGKIRSLNQALQEYFAESGGYAPVNGVILPKSGVPDMYTNNPPIKNTEVTNPNKWRPEFGALWSYLGGNPVDSSATLPLPPYSDTMAKVFLCKSDTPSYQRTYLGGQNADGSPQFGNSPLTLQTPPGGGNPVVVMGPGGPGYWSYSVNSVLNSLGRFRNRFQDASGNGTMLPWSDPVNIIRIQAPSDFITFVEEANDSIFNDEVFDAPAYSQGDQLTNRHAGNGNVGFADGHAEEVNQVLFDQVPSAIDPNQTGSPYVTHSQAMRSPITRQFFPDRGNFAVSD